MNTLENLSNQMFKSKDIEENIVNAERNKMKLKERTHKVSKLIIIFFHKISVCLILICHKFNLYKRVEPKPLILFRLLFL